MQACCTNQSGMARHGLTQRSGNALNDPKFEQVLRLELGFTEAYHASSRQEVLAAVGAILGEPNPKESDEPKNDNLFRGGPHIIGKVSRRVWAFDIQGKYMRECKSWSEDNLRALAGMKSATLQIHWADKLPFFACFIAFEYDPAWRPEMPSDPLLVQHVLDEFFDRIGGQRLSLNNRFPRNVARWLVGAKVTQQRMDELHAWARSGASSPKTGTAFRASLRELVPVLGTHAGALLTTTTSSNHMWITGEGMGGFIGEVGGSFSAFLFSDGNLIHDEGWPKHLLPLWVPWDVRFTSWHDARFTPFLVAVGRFAQWTGVEAGKIGEQLAATAQKFRRMTATPMDRRGDAWLPIQQDLLVMQGEVEQLAMDLDMASHRAITAPLQSSLRQAQEIGQVRLLPGQPEMFFGERQETWMELVDVKQASEQEADALLGAHRRRIREMLDIALGDMELAASHDMRKWGIRAFWVSVASAVVTLAALAVAILSLHSAR